MVYRLFEKLRRISCAVNEFTPDVQVGIFSFEVLDRIARALNCGCKEVVEVVVCEIDAYGKKYAL